MRCALFVPADSEKKLASARHSGSDALILDLEDAVSFDAKDKARRLAGLFLHANMQEKLHAQIYVRVNGLRSGLVEDDLDAVMRFQPYGIILPKAEGLRDVEHLGIKLAVREAEYGWEDGSTRILPMVAETARGALLMPSFIDRPNHRLAGLAWGAEDLATDIGATSNRDMNGAYTEPFRMVRHQVLMTSAAAGVLAIDAVHSGYRDSAGLERECVEAARDGFKGKFAIHPDQVSIIQKAFTPSPLAVEQARAVVAAFEKQGTGTIGYEGDMLDLPHLIRARQILEQAGHVLP
jgi:citrate lyase subunit beta / citryl-CoA lyase